MRAPRSTKQLRGSNEHESDAHHENTTDGLAHLGAADHLLHLRDNDSHTAKGRRCQAHPVVFNMTIAKELT